MDDAANRRDFLRRSGALGIAGAGVLGYPLLETRVAGAAPLLPPRDTIAAGGGATVKIGHIDGFSGVYAAASASQQLGMEVAVEAAMKKTSRIKYVILKGDDASAPATGGTEARRLISQEKVDVLTGCLSSGVGLAVSNIAEQLGTFFLAVGTHDTNITGQGAHHVTFRQTCSNAMLANAVGPAMLKWGKKWYFITADYAFGNDVAVGLPVDDIVGSTWGYVWGPEAGGTRTAAIYKALKAKSKNVDWRQYLGMMAAENIINRLNAIGTTDTTKLIASFEEFTYDAGKKAPGHFRKCDHQAVQQTYAGTIVPKAKRRSDGEYFVISSTVGGEFAAESCGEPDSAAATKVFTTETPIPAREGYSVLSLK